MKAQWKNRVYIDPFCGPGRAIVRGTNNRVETSPTIALREEFTHYIFRDIDSKKIDALQKRVNTVFREKENVDSGAGDINEIADQVCDAIPKSVNTLCFCFLDPPDLGLNFEMVRKLANSAKMDFLILLALDMDAKRAWRSYELPANKKVDRFLDDPNWRVEWGQTYVKRGSTFTKFVLRKFLIKMRELDYKHNDVSPAVFSKGRPLYNLGFFSKHPLGLKFCKEAAKYGRDRQLPF